MATLREKGYALAEANALEVLKRSQGKWMSAVKVTEALRLTNLGASRHIAARALTRLERKGLIQVQVIEVPGTSRSKEQLREYRVPEPRAEYPEWMEPRLAEQQTSGRIVKGYLSRKNKKAPPPHEQ